MFTKLRICTPLSLLLLLATAVPLAAGTPAAYSATLRIVETNAPFSLESAELNLENQEVVIKLPKDTPALTRLEIAGDVFGEGGKRIGGFRTIKKQGSPAHISELKAGLSLLEKAEKKMASPKEATFLILVTLLRTEFQQADGHFNIWELGDEAFRWLTAETTFLDGTQYTHKTPTTQNIDYGNCCGDCRGHASSTCGYNYNSRGSCSPNSACIDSMSCPYTSHAYTLPSPTGGTITIFVYTCSCEFECGLGCCY